MSMVLHYLSLVSPQIHDFSSAMVALCLVMFAATSALSGLRTLFGKPSGSTSWRFFFSGIVTFGLIWALFPA